MSQPGGTRRHLGAYRRDTYIPERPLIWEARPACPVLDCSLGYNPLGHSKAAEEAIRGADFATMAAYPEPFYDTTLRPAVLARFAGAGLRNENLFFGHGSFNIAERLIHKLIEPTSMLGYGPQFNEIPSEMVAAGGCYEPVPMTPDFRFPKEALIGRLREDHYSVVYIDNPNNPTGQLIDLADVEDVIEAAKRRGAIVLVDEAYGDFVDDRYSCFNIVAQHRNLIVVRSFSKGLGLASLRVGYAAMSKPLAQLYRKVDVPFEPTWLSVLAATATLRDADFINRTRRDIARAKAVLTSGLQDVSVEILPTHCQVSIFVAHTPGLNLFNLMASEGILTEAGSQYRRTFERFDDSFVRVRTPASEAISGEVVKRIGRALKRGLVI